LEKLHTQKLPNYIGVVREAAVVELLRALDDIVGGCEEHTGVKWTLFFGVAKVEA